MERLGYVAMNLGAHDFQVGIGFLLDARKKLSFPLISSNLIYKETGQPFASTYAITKAGDVNVGIVGVIPEDAFSSRPELVSLSERLEIIDPKKALEKIIPEIRNQANIIILLSQFEAKSTRALLDAFMDIDVAVFSQSGREQNPPVLEGHQKMVQVSHRSVNLGQLELTVDIGSRKTVQANYQEMKLGDSVESDPVFVKLINDRYTERNQKDRALQAEAEKRKIEKEQAELMKLSPAEYIELMHKQNSQGSVSK